jgi:hypothetical protein
MTLPCVFAVDRTAPDRVIGEPVTAAVAGTPAIPTAVMAVPAGSVSSASASKLSHELTLDSWTHVAIRSVNVAFSHLFCFVVYCDSNSALLFLLSLD